MKYEPWCPNAPVSGGSTELVVPGRELAARHGKLLLMAAFVQGFAEKLAADLESERGVADSRPRG